MRICIDQLYFPYSLITNIRYNLYRLGYVDSDKVLNSASSDCSGESGTLEWAMEQCNSNTNCKWLHDYGCDNKNWRFCTDTNIADYLYEGDGQEGCSKVKSTIF